ncbi:MAG: nitrogen regulation protein NR(II) [Pseudomonadales bacterium]|nr:nitrogen regulation protein NR(II) [Pseudomonadales bacterium]
MNPKFPLDIYKKALESLTTAVLLLDEGLRIQYLNPAAEQFFATSSSHLITAPITQLLHEEDEAYAELENALRNQHGFTKREVQLHFPNSSQAATVDYTVTPLVENQSRSLLVEIRPLDRLLRISREDGLLSAHQATRALVRGVAHEVKNPLGGIRGAAQLLSRELESDELKDYTNVIIAEADRLRNLVDRMLGPRVIPQLNDMNIHQVLERIKSIIEVESKGSVSVKRDYDPSLPELHADSDQLIQATLNIARNALQALQENPDQKNPSIVLRTRPLRQFTIGSTRHKLILLVEIEDNGPGISKELMETIFFPMVSGRAAGTGLGLSISQSIINQHHGLIECESEPGKTVFRLLLPYEVDEPQAGDNHAQSR